MRWCTLHCLVLALALATPLTHPGAHPVFTEQGRRVTGTFSFHEVHMFYMLCAKDTCDESTSPLRIARTCARPSLLFNQWAFITAHGVFLSTAAPVDNRDLLLRGHALVFTSRNIMLLRGQTNPGTFSTSFPWEFSPRPTLFFDRNCERNDFRLSRGLQPRRCMSPFGVGEVISTWRHRLPGVREQMQTFFLDHIRSQVRP